MSHFTSKFKSTPTPSFKSRNQTVTTANRPNYNPSPQQYTNNYHDISNQNNRGSGFGKQTRRQSLSPQQQAPGPGSYESTLSINLSSFNKKQTLVKGERFKESKEATPGPNSYRATSSNQNKNPQFSIGKLKRSLKEISGVKGNPGPTNYNPKKHLEPSVSISFSNSKRKINMQSQKTPGPGNYSTQKSFLSTSFNQKKDVLSKSKRYYSSTKLETLPGPGAYPSNSFFADQLKKGKGFTWQKRNRAQSLSATPGPGQYSSLLSGSKFKRHGGVLMAKSQRTLMTSEIKRSESVPGPGHTESSSDEPSKFSYVSVSRFAKNKLPRFEKLKQISHDFINPQKLDSGKKSVPSFSMPEGKREMRFNQSSKRSSPDVFYDAKLRSKDAEPSFSIPHSQRLQAESRYKMGPTDYQTGVNFLPDKKVKFSKQKRSTFMDDVINSKLKTFKGQTYQDREQFPNPPRYMGVSNKLKINDQKMKRT